MGQVRWASSRGMVATIVVIAACSLLAYTQIKPHIQGKEEVLATIIKKYMRLLESKNLPAIAKGRDVKLVGIAETNPELIAEAKKIAGDNVAIFADFKKMLAGRHPSSPSHRTSRFQPCPPRTPPRRLRAP